MFCSILLAQPVNYTKDVFSGPYLGYHFFDTNKSRDLENGFEAGLLYNQQFEDRLFWELGLGAIFSKEISSGENKTLLAYFINAQYEFPFYKKLTPYLLLGIGGDLGKTSFLGLNAGAGLKYYFSPTVFAKLEYKLIYAGSIHGTDQVLSLALSFPLDPTYIVDSDKDGVSNFADKCPGTPHGATVTEEGCFLQIDLKINFEVDSSQIKEEYSDRIIEFSDFLKRNPKLKIEIQGHTDNIGDYNYNLELSNSRAQNVANSIITHGVDANRIIVKGFGSDQPIADNETTEGQAQNRRIVVVLLK